jgi:CHASE3 domain sensor protein
MTMDNTEKKSRNMFMLVIIILIMVITQFVISINRYKQGQETDKRLEGISIQLDKLEQQIKILEKKKDLHK